MSSAAHALVLEMIATLREQPALRREFQLILGNRETAPRDDEWITSAEAARHLKINPATLRALAASGEIPSAQDAPGCRRYFKRSELDTWRATGAARD